MELQLGEKLLPGELEVRQNGNRLEHQPVFEFGEMDCWRMFHDDLRGRLEIRIRPSGMGAAQEIAIQFSWLIAENYGEPIVLRIENSDHEQYPRH